MQFDKENYVLNFQPDHNLLDVHLISNFRNFIVFSVYL